MTRNVEANREWQRAYYRQDPRRGLFRNAQARASRRGIPFNITLDDIVIPATCPYLGLVLVISNDVVTHSSPSLDRIDPAKGYVKGNIQVISALANGMKRDATLDQLRTFSRSVLALHGESHESVAEDPS